MRTVKLEDNSLSNDKLIKKKKKLNNLFNQKVVKLFSLL